MCFVILPRLLPGPVQSYPSMYPITGYYGAPAQQQQSYSTIPSQATPVSSKAPITNSAHSANYYQNNHPQQLQHAPLSSAPPSQPYATHPSSAPPPSNQHPPYTTPASYYGPQSYHASPAQQSQQQQQQPSLVPMAASGPGGPLYPIVSYPSAPGSSQYGTLSSSQSTTQMGAPLHQYGAEPPASSASGHSGYGMAPPSQVAPTVNAQNAVHSHYSQTNQASLSYNSYGGVTQSSGGAEADRPPSGTPSASVHSSPGHRQGKNESKSSLCIFHFFPSLPLAGGDTSSSSTGSASPVPNSYDSLEGGSYPGTCSSQTDSHLMNFGCKLSCLFVCGVETIRPSLQPFPSLSELSAALGGLSGVPELEVEALRPINLLQERNLLPPRPLEAPEPNLSPDLKKVNCSPQTFRCTLTSVPQTQALLNKARLPLGLLLHPFRDLQQLPVITSNTIVRCRSCRTYINPFVTFLDQRRWKCNLCYRVNDVPDEFMYNPVTRSYGEPHKRPEVQNSTVEFIASSDYMLRPPQPAAYLFVLDVSHNAVEAGYLKYFCESLLGNLDKLPGDSRTRVGFLTFDSTIHFYNLQEGLSQPQMLVVSDIDDVFIPSHDSLMVNLKESNELVKDLLKSLPALFSQSRETHSALGPALQAAFKLMSPTGGRITVFQTQLPTLGAGKLQSREDPNQRSSSKGAHHLGPATDFYKKLALDCSGQQIGVDLFLLSSQYADLASLACISRYSAGSVFYYPSFHYIHNPAQLEKFQRDLERYLTRKIGFEAVMRIRCTKGLSIHTFHGNFFVRSTDLLSLANVNPDSAFAVQMSVEDSLADSSLACFQAALLYTSSKGKRRIRVHTLCLPVVSQLSDVYAGADVQAITCLLANMAIDRSISSSLSDARDALVNAVVDLGSAYKSNVSNLQQSGLVLPAAMRLFPLYILALLKQKALRTGTSTRLDERVFAMCEFKTQPLQQLMRMVHPDLYRLDNISDQGALHLNDTVVPQPHLLHLSAERLSRDGAFLMDCGNVFYLWIGKCCNEMFIRDVLGCPNYASIPPNMSHIPELETPLSERVRAFLDWLHDNERSAPRYMSSSKDDASAKATLFQHLVEDRSEWASSYHEFLQHIQQQVSK
uniref:SEC24 homolog B, COPII coat complex component n=1 Tax=Maylandia zebra TaxID=106582 RepID=A0A3P9BQV6_9CICH